MVGDIRINWKRGKVNNHFSIEERVQIMGFIKTREEKEQRLKEKQKLKLDIQRRNESRKKAIQEQNKKNEEIRRLYRERVSEEKTREYLAAMFAEDADGCELSVSSFPNCVLMQ